MRHVQNLKWHILNFDIDRKIMCKLAFLVIFDITVKIYTVTALNESKN